jgi:glycosyltransferase involved in cell wall biosynthesis
MRIAFLVPDNRENFRQYELTEPYFGTAPTALLAGFAMLGESGGREYSEIQKFRNSANRKRGLGELGTKNQELGVAPPFEIHVISCTQKKIPAPKKLASNIWFHLLHVPKAGWLRSGYLGCAFAVRKKLKEIQPDLVHAQGTERDCAISAVLSPYPKILTIHGNLRLIKKQVGFRPLSAMWFQSLLEGFAVSRFTGVICITEYTHKAVEAEVPKTWVVPNAVDPSFLALGQQRLSDSCSRPSTLNSRPPCPVILCVANVDPRKNQNAFIKALDPLTVSMNFKVRFFGSCPDDEYGREFRRLVSERPWCHYGGMIGRGELRNQFAEAELLVLPTHEDNCPMAVLEAMASRVPVMASKVGGVPDLINGTTTGLFCYPNETESFRSGVTRLLKDPSLAEFLREAAYKEAMERFHPKVVAQRHLEIYREVLNP